MAGDLSGIQGSWPIHRLKGLTVASRRGTIVVSKGASALMNTESGQPPPERGFSMKFTTIDASVRSNGRSSSVKPVLTFYGETSQFRLSAPIVAAMGNPVTILAGYDDESNVIGFIPSDSPQAVTLRKDSETSGSRYFGFRALAEAANLSQDQRFALPVQKDEESGYWYVDLAQLADPSTTIAPRKRTPKNAAPVEAGTEAGTDETDA